MPRQDKTATHNSSAKKRSAFLDTAFSILFTVSFAGALSGNLHLLQKDGIVLVSGMAWKVAALLALLLWLSASPLCRRTLTVMGLCKYLPKTRPNLNPAILTLGLGLLILSDYMTRRFTFYALYSSMVSWQTILILGALTCAVVSALQCWKGKRVWEVLFSPILLFICQVAVFYVFVRYVDGRLIFSDDHPTFLYRLQLLMRNFPAIPFYNTDWNAGVPARDFFATGVLNVFFLSWPLLRLWGDFETLENARIYSYLIPYLFVVLVPWTVYFASRLMGFSGPSAVISGILVLAPSLTFFEWILKYGTLGFMVSAGLTPLAFSLCARIVMADKNPRFVEVAAAVIVTTLLSFWPLALLALVPLVALALLHYKHTFSRDRAGKVAAFFLLFGLLNAPWFFFLFREFDVPALIKRSTLPGSHAAVHAHDSKQAGSVTAPEDTQPAAKAPGPLENERFAARWAKEIKKTIRGSFAQLNPAIFFFFIPGLLALSGRRIRSALVLTLLWLIFFTVLGKFWKPQLELHRMIVPAGLLMAVLAGAGIWQVLLELTNTRQKSAAFRIVQGALVFSAMAVLLGTVFITPMNAAAVYRNASDHHYVFASSHIQRLVDGIKRSGGSGRTMFLGFVLHNLGASSSEGRDGGHLAPLPKFTGHSMYASHFAHAFWNPVEPIPHTFRSRKAEGIEEFLDLVNATSVVAFQRNWKQYCTEQPNYSLVYCDDRICLFSRTSAGNGYFLKGSGEIAGIGDDRVEIVPHEQDTVIKFRYDPSLRVFPSESAALAPVYVFDEERGGHEYRRVEYIRLIVDEQSVAAKRKFVIGYHGPVE